MIVDDHPMPPLKSKQNPCRFTLPIWEESLHTLTDSDGEVETDEKNGCTHLETHDIYVEEWDDE